MDLENAQIELRALSSLSDVHEAQWDALLRDDDNPFVSWSFLEGLERTGCVRPDRGWHPCHLTAWLGDRILAAAPAYVKNDGFGDFSRDWGMADAARRFGVSLYPKLVVGVPFSPVTGRRILISEALEDQRTALTQALTALAEQLARHNDLSSINVLYHHPDECEALEAAGLAPRNLIQYHWRNYGYQALDDWLARLKASKRKSARREMRAPGQQELRIRTIRGDEVRQDPQRWAQTAYRLYATTCDKYMWGGTYLNQAFYEHMFGQMSDQVELVVAERESSALKDEVVAGATMLATPTHLYGRYWGCFEEHRFLHFNVCLYHGIQQCIERGIQRFEGGAGGEHKLLRGFEPSLVYCAHRFLEPQFQAVMDHALRADRDSHIDAVTHWHEKNGLDRAERRPSQRPR